VHGVGRAAGAISYVNALPTGVGCAVAVHLPVEAEADLNETSGDGDPRIDIPPESDTPLLRGSVRHALGLFGPGRRLDCRLEVRSEIPPARGLKSSSAVSVAVLRAVAGALHRTVTPEQVSRAAADIGIRLGLSATGAFDDAMASATGDVVVADNPSRSVLRREPPDPRWVCVLWIPSEGHPRSPTLADTFRAEATDGEQAAALALSGEFLAAMESNTRLVERVMGYEYSELRRRVADAGAVACGVSGMGPSVAALAPPGAQTAVAAAFPIGAAALRVVSMGAPPGGP
jgi:shikimate kinase